MLVAKGYRAVDREQQFLLPPDMRSWLPVDHPVFWVIDVVGRLDTTKFHTTRRTGGVGRPGYDPDMLLTLLIWAWSQGQRSSRVIERCCQQDVAYRIICAGDIPDHVTISRFRGAMDTAVQDLFAQVLVLCAELGMGRLGVVALDGVKIASNASTAANRTEDGLTAAAAAEAGRRQAKQEAARAAAEHASTDRDEDTLFGSGARPDTVPDDYDIPDVDDSGADPSGTGSGSRAARIDQALAVVQAAKTARTMKSQRRAPRTGPPTEFQLRRAEETVARQLAKQQKKVDDWAIWYANYVREMRIKPNGGHPVPPEEHNKVIRARKALAALQERAAAAAETGAVAVDKTDPGHDPVGNITDPESRLMPLRGGGWLQGYNCQAVTSQDGLIIATSVGSNPVDAPTFQPMMTAAATAAALIDQHRPAATGTTAGGIGILLADAGYLSRENLTAQGPDRLIAIGKARALEAAARTDPASGPAPDDADPIAAMAHRLRTPAGIAAYRQRSHIAETPFGHTKHNLGFRQFTGRGLQRATTEFAFNAIVNNLIKAFTHTVRTT